MNFVLFITLQWIALGCIGLISADTLITKLECDSGGTISVSCSPGRREDLTAAIRENTTLHCSNRYGVQDTINIDNVNTISFDECSFDALPAQFLANYKNIGGLSVKGVSLRAIRPDDIPVLMPVDSRQYLPSFNPDVSLDLSDNNIEHIAAGTFSHQKHLRHLDLANNRLERIDANTFHGLHELGYLELKRNLVNQIESRAFESLTKLKTLHLNDNKLSVLDASWFNVTNQISSLDVSSNQIVRLTRDFFNRLPFLRLLNANDCKKLETIEDDAFEGLTKLTDLNLRDSPVQRISAKWFAKDNKLESLDLHNSPIDRLESDSFERLTHLKLLLLTSNNLTEIPAHAFEQLHTLKWLNLAQNNISRLGASWIGADNQLDILELSRNSFTRLNQSNFQHLSKLRNLLISRSQIMFIENGTFAPLVNLEWLDLSHNRLVQFHTVAIFHAATAKLRQLQLLGNRLREFSIDTDAVPSLKSLDLDNNSNELNCTVLEKLTVAIKSCGKND